MRRGALVAAVVGAGLVAAPAAEACSMAYVKPSARVRAADAAIYGTVVSVRYLDAVPEGQPVSERRIEAKVRISRVYKGRMGPAVRIRGHDQESACGIGVLRVGQRLGLLLDGRRSPFGVDLGDRISAADLNSATRGRWHRPGPA